MLVTVFANDWVAFNSSVNKYARAKCELIFDGVFGTFRNSSDTSFIVVAITYTSESISILSDLVIALSLLVEIKLLLKRTTGLFHLLYH